MNKYIGDNIEQIKNVIKKEIKRVVLIIYHIFIMIFRVKKKVIVFESNLGRNYTGNPRYIYEELVNRGLDEKYKCYFIFENLDTEIIGNATKVKRNRLKYFYIMSIAKCFVCDSRLPKFFVKRKGVTYLQTWHGTPLKKLALDMDEVSMAGETDIESYKRNFKEDASKWDFLISQNSFSTNTFRRAFDFDKTMIEIGYPRNDILVNNDNKEYINELKVKFQLPLDKKIILYAPTWRDNEFHGNGKYKFSQELDFDMAKEMLGEEYIFIVKYHYLVKDNINWAAYKGFIYDFDMSYDIAQLYLVSDLLITDYSSVMFDYTLLKRPILFYTYDLENYKENLRGFYFDFLSEAPGPIALTSEELINSIIQYKYEQYKVKYKKFCRKYNYLDIGTASKEVVNLIVNEIM